jgi:hypothetical protein
MKKELDIDLFRSARPPYTLQILSQGTNYNPEISNMLNLPFAVTFRKSSYTKEQLLQEFGSKFSIQGTLSGWDSLIDRMRDVADAKEKVLLIFVNGSGVLRGKPDEFSKLLRTLDAIGQEWATPIADGEWWDRQAIPFHSVFLMSSNASS